MLYNDSMEDAVLGGRYQLQERIGIGGMSVVYRALDRETHSIVAIKTLKAEYCSDLEFVRRFQNEIKATSDLQHPNIVKIFNQGEEGGMPYIVMEFIEGITLKDYIVALQTLKWKDAFSVTAQVLSAVACAHEHKVIHRDIKPQNIMITDEGQIKLTDFGIARVVSSATKQAKQDSAGSVHYLSPEQARGGLVDERSDLYSIGIMLYEMVTGVVPFDGESHVSIALKHIDGHIVPPQTLDPEIPKGVSDFIMVATNKNPLQRFQSAEDMYDRMKKVSKEPNYSFLGDLQVLVEEEEEVSVQTGFISAPEQHDYKADRTEIIRTVTSTVLAYTLAVIVGLLGIVFVVSRFDDLKKNMGAFGNTQYEVQDYTGMQADMVSKTLTEKGLQVQKVPVESDTIPVGYVVRQSIEEGTLVEERAVIELEVASLSGSFVLESYAGTDYRAAGAQLGSLGLKVSYTPIASGKYKEQNVVRTAPDAGSIVVAGDAVTVYYSIGTLSQTVSVPDLSGKTYDEAQKELEKLGLRVGTVYPEPGSDITDLVGGTLFTVTTNETLDPALPSPSEGPSDSTATPDGEIPPEAVYASETVIAQYPVAGTKVYKYETVSLYFCETTYLESSKEFVLEFPENIKGSSCDVRITVSDVGSGEEEYDILYDKKGVRKSEFPLTVEVPFSYYGAPVRVTVRINGKVYQEIVMYE
ncbi:MAG: Stk1 family PASTA domain-containing Ser/Thr kinase [Clostridia bacterium]|nr:Stk1 family PASTA domain-containing Ser/Thr kinase [Clostridia bacterium]